MPKFDRAYLLRNTSIVSICNMLGVISGLALDAGILACFGLGNQTDAFFAALSVPFLINATLSIQLTQVIIPILAAIRGKSGDGGVNAFLSNIITIWLVFVSIFASVGMVGSKWIIPLQVPGWTGSRLATAIELNMILVWLLPLLGLSAILCGALYSMHCYWLSSSTKAINNISIIAVGVLTYRQFGIRALAIGYVAGAAVQCLILSFALVLKGFRFWPRLNVGDSTVSETARLIVYPLAGQMLGESRTLLENFCASFYAPGILSALRYASRIVQSVSGVLISSVVTATTPMVAHYVAERDFIRMKKSIRNGMKLLIFMSVPLSVWLIFVGDKFIRLLFQRGQFTGADVVLTGMLLVLLTPYILFARVVSIMQTPFYAVKDTKTLVISNIWSFVLYLLTVPPALFFFGVYGFPLATSIAVFMGALVMCILAHRKFGSMEWVQLNSFALRMLVSVAVSCVGFLLGNKLSSNLGRPGFLGNAVAAGIPSLLGLAFFTVGTVITGLLRSDQPLGHRRLGFLSFAGVRPRRAE